MRVVLMEQKNRQLKVRIWLSISVALVFFVFCIVFFRFPDNSRENFVFRIDEDGYAMVMGYTGDASTLEIPSEYEGHAVKYIAENAFGGHLSSLKKVVIPSSVEEIGADAFSDCPELKTVVLNEGLKTIGFGAFRNCTALKRITLPESLERIDDYAFNACISLSSLKIPANVDYIGYEAFGACESLRLDVSENALAAEVAQEYRIDTGEVNTFAIQIAIIAVVSVAGVAVAVILIRRFSVKRQKKEKDAS